MSLRCSILDTLSCRTPSTLAMFTCVSWQVLQNGFPGNDLAAAGEYLGALGPVDDSLQRAAKCIVELDDETRDNIVGAADWACLGAAIAEKAENRIPAVLNLPKNIAGFSHLE
jgi:hypothetical protein